MIIYLDESGNLGFNFSLAGTSQYLIISGLICHTQQAAQAAQRAVIRTRKNKMGANTVELKGNSTSLPVKKYFYNHLAKHNDWEIIAIAANKQAWLKHHGKNLLTVDKNFFYDEVVKRLLSQINLSADNSHIQLIIDKSKTRNAVKVFDHSINSMIRDLIPKERQLSIQHRRSDIDPGLQIADLFSWGIYRKYQNNDLEWYEVFQNRIALEMEFKF